MTRIMNLKKAQIATTKTITITTTTKNNNDYNINTRTSIRRTVTKSRKITTTKISKSATKKLTTTPIKINNNDHNDKKMVLFYLNQILHSFLKINIQRTTTINQNNCNKVKIIYE